MTDNRLTIGIEMQDGVPIRAETFARQIIATVRTLRDIDKNMVGKVTLDWYIVGFDLQADGIAYQLAAFPKGDTPRITSITHDGPPLVGKAVRQTE